MRTLIVILFSLCCFLFGISYAQEAGHAHTTQTVAERPGKQIRQTSIKGYTLTYRLLDPSERGEMMNSMEGHSVLGMKKISGATNHLMVYILKPDGKIVPGDVAFLLTGPDGKDFTTMTMGMYGGYGADVNLGLKGVYTIRAKIITGGRDNVKLDDEFTFQVK